MSAKIESPSPTTATNDAVVAAAVRDTVAIVLAGGKGTRLGALTRYECKPALPFGARCRTVDFSLSNCVNSGIHRVGVATQYKDLSLVRHISRVWRYRGAARDRFVEPWRASRCAPVTGYRGTADAVYRNWETMAALDPRLVLVLAGDHVYKMDYRPLLQHHLGHGADATVACIEVPVAEASEYGVMSVDIRGRIVRFSEKPHRPESLPGRPDRALASMGIYVFDAAFLGRILQDDAVSETSGHDFGRDVIPRLSNDAKLFAYPFADDVRVGGGYWRDVGTLRAYWQAHMDLLDGTGGFRLADAAWPVWSEVPIVRLGSLHDVYESLLAPTCEVNQAAVRRSVLFDGVTVDHETTLTNAVILRNARIGRQCHLDHVVVAGGVWVPDGTIIQPRRHRHDSRATAEPVLVTAETIAAAFAAEQARIIPYGRRSVDASSALHAGT